jgi:hypothetical protein
MTNSLEDEINHIVESMDNQENQEQDTQTPQEEIQDIYVLVVREGEELPTNTQVVDSTPAVTTQPAPIIVQKDTFISAYMFLCFSLFLIVSTLSFQLFCLFHPPTATVTLLPRSRTVMLSGTLQLGRMLSPLTLSQSQTTPTTGKGHQDAKAATGQITLYNGEFQSVTIAAGTILTGASAIQVVTDQGATIPPGNPPNYGQVTISAHALNQGVKGNIPAYDMNQACCAASVLAKNTQPFTGGQDERDFQTVAKSDIASTATPLKTSLAQSLSGAFQGQLKPNEQLHLLPCTPTVSSDHQPGQEAALVKVTVSQTCSAAAYNSQELATRAATLLSQQALQKMGAGYRSYGMVQVNVTKASIPNSSKVFLSFHVQGTWIYALSQTAQQRIKAIIAGKTTQEALQMLAALPGIEQASIQWGDDTKLPTNTESIRVVVMYGI